MRLSNKISNDKNLLRAGRSKLFPESLEVQFQFMFVPDLKISKVKTESNILMRVCHNKKQFMKIILTNHETQNWKFGALNKGILIYSTTNTLIHQIMI